MLSSIVIIGSTGNCIDIADAVRASAGYIRGFLDDNPSAWGTVTGGAPVLGPLSLARELVDVSFVCGIGSPRSYRGKRALIERLGISEDRFATVVHPSAAVSGVAQIERGSVILANCTICANVRVGRHVMMLPNCVVGHDSTLGDYTVMAAGVVVSGNVEVDENCYLGAAVSVRDGLRLGSGALVGMGSVVVADIDPGSIVAGVPARAIGNSDGLVL